jgi:hypothetical protein
MSTCPYTPIRKYDRKDREVGKVVDKSGKGRNVIGSLLLTVGVVGLYLLGYKIRKLKRKIKELTDDSSGTNKANCKSVWGST